MSERDKKARQGRLPRCVRLLQSDQRRLGSICLQANLIGQWVNEIDKFAKDAYAPKVLVFHTVSKRPRTARELAEYDIVLTTPQVRRSCLPFTTLLFWWRMPVLVPCTARESAEYDLVLTTPQPLSGCRRIWRLPFRRRTPPLLAHASLPANRFSV